MGKTEPSEMRRIRFLPGGREIVCPTGTTVLEAAQEAGVYLEAQCGGVGTCGKCRVRIVEGDGGTPVPQEVDRIGKEELSQGVRLACRALPRTDVTVFVPQESLVTGRSAEKGFVAGRIRREPAVRSYSLDLSKEGKAPTRSAVEIALWLLGLQHGLDNVTADPSVPAQRPRMGSGKGSRLEAEVWMDRELVALRRVPARVKPGLAVDIGTTTVALYLCDLATGRVMTGASFTNPQVIFGEDVMSRIRYSTGHPGVGVALMQRELVTRLNRAVSDLARKAGVSPRDISDMTAVGNTVMHHILLGVPPDSLGLAPFTPLVQDPVDVKARDLGITIAPSAYVHVLPVEAGFVGADNVGVLISEQPYRHAEVSLIIDVGTNGEVVLGNRSRMLCCSCATGPAFEGSHITWGMRAAPGAIEKVHIDPGSFEADYRVIGHARWKSASAAGSAKAAGICGSGIVDLTAQLYRAGLLTAGGAFVSNAPSSRLRKGGDGQKEFVVAFADESIMGRDIVITQKDVRQIQLAKAALQAGCTILMERLGMGPPSRVVLAGAFGMHLDPDSARTIGLLPQCDADAVSAVGNAAGRGAYLALMDRRKREEAAKIARWVEHVDLAADEAFQETFLDSLSFPAWR